MYANLEALSIDAIKKGYIFFEEHSCYVCLICGERFEEGEIYQIGGRFFEAAKAAELHMLNQHSDRFSDLLDADSKYVSLTDNQKELLNMIHAGLSDSEIAEKMGVSASTVRHQRFVFREKVKQAKMYLAIYELAVENKQNETEKYITIHEGAKMVDNRYDITTEERDKIIKNVFESFSPLKLKVFSAKEKKKIVILSTIAQQFEKNIIYPEKEINRILGNIYEDYATLRRYLVEYGYMERTRDCSEYWLK